MFRSYIYLYRKPSIQPILNPLTAFNKKDQAIQYTCI